MKDKLKDTRKSCKSKETKILILEGKFNLQPIKRESKRFHQKQNKLRKMRQVHHRK